MSSPPQDAQPLRIADYLVDAQTLDVAAFAARRGRAFLVCESQLDRMPVDDPNEITWLASGRGAGRLQPMDYLVFPVAPTSRSRFPGLISVGRSAERDVVLAHPSVSSFHACFTTSPSGELLLQDGGSRNGTFIEDQAAPGRDAKEGALLTSGAIVRFGIVELTFLKAPELYRLVQRVARARKPAGAR